MITKEKAHNFKSLDTEKPGRVTGDNFSMRIGSQDSNSIWASEGVLNIGDGVKLETLELTVEEIKSQEIETLQTHSRSQHALHRIGIGSVDSRMEVPSLVESTNQENSLKHVNKEALLVTNLFRIPIMKMSFSKDTITLNEEVISLFENSLGRSDSLSAIKRVLDEVGHYVATEITLGGLITVSNSVNDINDTSALETLKLITRSMGCSSTTALKSHSNGGRFDEYPVDILSTGISLRDSSTIEEWYQNLSDPQSWMPIEVHGVLPIVEYLPENVGNAVYGALLNAGYTGYCGNYLARTSDSLND